MRARQFLGVLAGLAILAWPAWSQPAPPARTNAPPDQTGEGQRTKVTSWSLGNAFKKETTDLREFGPPDFDRTGQFAGEQANKLSQSSDLKNISELFQRFSFEEIEAVAKAKKISPQHSEQIALARRQMINQAMAETLRQLDPNKQLKIGMLDSGNKGSGIASDVDQTIFVIPPEKGKALGIDEQKVIAAFDANFQKLFGCTPMRLGIESMNGADFFPDWRAEHTLGDFNEEVDRVVDEKRKNNNAYRSEGQLKSQAEGRGYQALQEHGMKVEAVDDLRSKLAAIDSSAKSDAEKATQRNTAETEFRAQFPEFEGKTLAQVEESLSKNSPWTEVDWHPDGENTRTTQVEDPRGKVLKLEPEMVKRFAFDGAWDNWLMFEAHPHNRRKYLLRSMAEGISLLRPMEAGRATPLEYEKLFSERDPLLLDAFLADVYPDLRGDQLMKRKRALAVASMERLRHKGAKFSDAEIWKEYMPVLNEAEKKMYADVPEKVLNDVLMERAVRAWEVDAREIMFENLLRTVTEPHQFLNNNLTEAEFREVQKKFPGATREKLQSAVRKQLFHAIHDLLSPEHLKALNAPPDQQAKLHEGRQKDMVDRFLAQVEAKGTANLKEEIRSIVADAARQRFFTDPGLQPFRTADALNAIKAKLKIQYASLQEEYKQAKANWDSGKYTKEYVGNRIFEASCERIATSSAQMLHSMGFNVTAVNLIIAENKLSKFPIEIEFDGKKFDAKRAMQNFASAGNLDSALQVALAYQQGGASDAAWALGREIVFNVPGVAHANALYEGVFKGEPRGVVMLGSAMYVPALGQVYILVSISTTAVTLLGHAVLDPLSNDTADLAYQGFLGKENQFNRDQASQRFSILERVPIRVVPLPFKDKDGKDQTTYVTGPYSVEEAMQLGWTQSPEEAQWMANEGVLGGGEEWYGALARAQDWVNNSRLNFEAKRASLFYHYEQRARTYLERQGSELDAKDAGEHLTRMFVITVNHWVNGQGEFAGLVEGENELIARRFPEDVQTKIASRMAGDFLWSHQLVRADTNSLEVNIARNVEKARNDRLAAEVQGQTLAITDAYQTPADDTLAAAMRYASKLRMEQALAPSPRIHVRPTLVKETNAVTKKLTEQIKPLVTVVAATNQHPAPYSFEADWTSRQTNGNEYLHLKLAVFDANKKPVGQPKEKTIAEWDGLEGDLPVEMQEFRGSTRLIVRTKAMTELDELFQKKASWDPVQFVLWRAQSADGPFEELKTLNNYFPQNGKRFIPESDLASGRIVSGRLDEERMMTTVDYFPADAKAVESPFYYRVSLRKIRWGKGKYETINEITSRVVKPGKPIIRAYDLQSEIGDTATPEPRFWAFGLGLSLSIENQGFDFPHAHFVVKWGDWTGHHWSASTNDGWEAIDKQSWAWSFRDNKVRTPPPFRKDYVVTIQATCNDVQANRTITLNYKGVDDAEKESQLKQIAEWVAREKEHPAWHEKELASKQSYLKSCEETLAKARQNNRDTKNAEAYLEYAKIGLDTFLRADSPASLAGSRYQRAQLEGNGRLGLESSLIQMEADRIRYEAKLKSVAADERIRQEDPQKYAQRRAEIEKDYSNLRGQIHGFLDAAFRAGDGKTLLKVFNEWAAWRLTSTNKYDIASVGSYSMEAAEKYVMISGDQSGAAALYLRGVEIRGQLGDTQLVAQFKTKKPAWWPRGAQDVIKPAAFVPVKSDEPAANTTTNTPSAATTPPPATETFSTPATSRTNAQTSTSQRSPTSEPTTAPQATVTPATQPVAVTTTTPAITNIVADAPTPPPNETRPRTPANPSPNPTPTALLPQTLADANAAYAKGDNARALQLYNDVLATDPKNAEARFKRGAARLWTTDVTGALTDYRELVYLQPANVEARRVRAGLELVAGDQNLATKEALELAKAHRSALTLLLAGQTALYGNRSTEARSYFQQAAAMDPRLGESVYQQGTQFYNARVWQLAYLSYYSAVWLNPNNYAAYYGMGSSSVQLGWNDRAVDAFQRYLQNDPASSYAQSARQEIQRLKSTR